MEHPALPGGWGTVSSIGCGSVCAVPAMLTQIHSNNPPAAYTLLGGGYLLYLPFTPQQICPPGKVPATHFDPNNH